MISPLGVQKMTLKSGLEDSNWPLERSISTLTKLSVARGVGFAAILVICFLSGFSGEPVYLAKAASLGSIVIAMTLFFKSITSSPELAPRTEVALMLRKSGTPLSPYCQKLICVCRRQICLQWAGYTAILSIGSFAMSVVLALEN